MVRFRVQAVEVAPVTPFWADLRRAVAGWSLPGWVLPVGIALAAVVVIGTCAAGVVVLRLHSRAITRALEVALAPDSSAAQRREAQALLKLYAPMQATLVHAIALVMSTVRLGIGARRDKKSGEGQEPP